MAQTVAPLAVEDALQTKEFAELTPIALSPDGKWLAYTTKDNQKSRAVEFKEWVRSGVRSVFTGTDIWMVNTETRETKNLTGDIADNFLPTWSPDGRYLAFVSDRDGEKQLRLWIWDTARNQLKRISNLGVRQFGQLQWTSDSKSIITPVVPQDLSLEAYVEKVASSSGSESATTGRTPGSTTVVLYKSEIPGSESKSSTPAPLNLDLRLRDLASIDVATGNARIIVRDKRIGTFLLSPDGSRLAYTVQKSFEKPSSQQILFDVQVLALGTGEDRLAASNIRLNYDGSQFSWSPDSVHLVYRSYGPEERNNDCFLVNANREGSQNLTNLPPEKKGVEPVA